MLLQAQVLWICLRARYADRATRSEDGTVVETVIITAVFAALALAVGVIIMLKVTSKANSIDLN